MPLYPVNIGDVAEITFIQRLNAQTVLNVFHYVWDIGGTVANGDGELAALATNLTTAQDSLLDAMLDCQTPEVEHTGVRAQLITSSTRYIYQQTLYSLDGQHVGDALPPNVSAVVTKRVQAPGRGRNGRVSIAGAPTSQVASGLWVDAFLLKLAVVGQRMTATVNGLAQGGQWKPCTLHRLPTFGTITVAGYAVQPQSRTQRRRTVGLGI